MSRSENSRLIGSNVPPHVIKVSVGSVVVDIGDVSLRGHELHLGDRDVVRELVVVQDLYLVAESHTMERAECVAFAQGHVTSGDHGNSHRRRPTP